MNHVMGGAGKERRKERNWLLLLSSLLSSLQPWEEARFLIQFSCLLSSFFLRKKVGEEEEDSFSENAEEARSRLKSDSRATRNKAKGEWSIDRVPVYVFYRASVMCKRNNYPCIGNRP